MATALATLMSLPAVPLAPHKTPIDYLERLAATLGPSCPRLFMKRDDLLSFGMGGSKVRKMHSVLAEAMAGGADTLITCGGVQSNHARVTAAAGAAQGLKVVLVLSGEEPTVASGNILLDRLFGADVYYVPTRNDRVPMMEKVAANLRVTGRKPFIIPLGASTVTGALGLARGVAEVSGAGLKPDVIVHATSSGGTQAGLISGCALVGLHARVIGISADERATTLEPVVSLLLAQIADKLRATVATVGAHKPIEIDDRWVGEGYGRPTIESTTALELVARREGILLDPVYTAKAMAGLLSMIREGAFKKTDTILFWHTGGQALTLINEAMRQ